MYEIRADLDPHRGRRFASYKVAEVYGQADDVALHVSPRSTTVSGQAESLHHFVP